MRVTFAYTVRGDESAPAKYTLKLSDGRELAADHVINAVSRCTHHHFDPRLFQHLKGLFFKLIGEVLRGEQLLPSM
jgi:hypothetical protein